MTCQHKYIEFEGSKHKHVRKLLIVTDYVYFSADKTIILTDDDLWNEKFYKLYSKTFDRIVIVAQNGGIPPEEKMDRLYTVDNRYFDLVSIPFSGNRIAKWIFNSRKIQCLVYKEMLNCDAVLFKLFYISSILASFKIKEAKRTNPKLVTSAQLVGDAQQAVLMRKDILPSWALRFLSLLVGSLIKKILNEVDIPCVVAKQLKNKFVPKRNDVLISNESWLENWMFAPSRETTYPPRSILFVGRLISGKGVDKLAESYKKLLNTYKITLGIVGDGPLRDQLQEMLADEVRNGNVKFYGWIKGNSTEIYEIYREYDVFCLPTYAEGLPLVLLEAMANKLAVIATAVNGIPEIVVDGESGCLIEHSDPDLICRAFERLYNDISLYENVIKNGYKTAIQNTFASQRGKLADAIQARVLKNSNGDQ